MGRGTVRLLVAAAVVMGVLIVGGTATLIALVALRPSASRGVAVPPAGPAVLDEPAGTRIAGATGTADALVLRLQGGGPDRVVVLDAQTGRVLARAGLVR